MKIDVRQHGVAVVLRPQGALVGEDVDQFQQAVAGALGGKSGRVVVDLSEVPYLDSRGIESLLALSASGGTPPTLAALGDTCREALDLTDVLARLCVFDTVENAIRSQKR